MEKTKVMCAMLFFTWGNLFAQAPETLWQKTYNGTWGTDVKQTSDGGFIITGFTVVESGNSDLLLMKTDSNGNQIWAKTYGGADGLEDAGSSVVETSDGGFLVAGDFETFEAGPGSPIHSDLWLIKTNAAGEKVDEFVAGELEQDKAAFISPTDDGGFIVTGRFEFNRSTETTEKYDADIWLLKFTSNGDTVWTKTYGSTALNEVGRTVHQTSWGGYIIAATDQMKNDRIFLLKTDANGNGGFKEYEGFLEEGTDFVRETNDGGFIVAGNTLSDQILLFKTDVDGNLLWRKTYGNNAHATSVRQTQDGGYIVSGFIANESIDGWILRTDENGDTLWAKTIDIGGAIDGFFSIDLTEDGGYVLTGTSNDEVLLTKLGPEQATSVENQATHVPVRFKLSQNHPNPFNPSTKISYSIPRSGFVTLKVYDMLAREIRTLVNKFQQANVYSVTFNASDLPSGVYFYKLQVGDFSEMKKMLYLR
jgi:hypothetical protein